THTHTHTHSLTHTHTPTCMAACLRGMDRDILILSPSLSPLSVFYSLYLFSFFLPSSNFVPVFPFSLSLPFFMSQTPSVLPPISFFISLSLFFLSIHSPSFLFLSLSPPSPHTHTHIHTHPHTL